jgi:hypothetical protein
MTGVFGRLRFFLLCRSILLACLTTACTVSLSNVPHPVDTDIPSLKEHFPVALAEATEWHPDAFVFWAQLEIDYRSRMIYIFESPAFPGYWLRVAIEFVNDEIAVATSEGYIEEPRQDNQPIPLEASLLDSAEVVDLALAHGGQAFIDRHPGARDLLVQLVAISGAAADELGLERSQPIWRVAIFSLPTPGIDLIFDPFTGEFLGSILQE